MNSFKFLENGTKLSPQETKVLNLLIEGDENIEIANKLHISTHTVKVHITSILKKLDAKNRTQAACTAIKKGLC